MHTVKKTVGIKTYQQCTYSITINFYLPTPTHVIVEAYAFSILFLRLFALCICQPLPSIRYVVELDPFEFLIRMCLCTFTHYGSYYGLLYSARLRVGYIGKWRKGSWNNRNPITYLLNSTVFHQSSVDCV